MQRCDYDTPEGIRNALATLSGFHRLVATRQEQGLTDELGEFVVLGRFLLDKSGQLWHSNEKAPREIFPDMPNVMDVAQYDSMLTNWLQKTGSSAHSFGWCQSTNTYLAPAEFSCTICNQFWTALNCHDCHVEKETIFFPTQGFVGRPIEELHAHLLERRDAHYRPEHEPGVRNDRFINLSKRDGCDMLLENEYGWAKLDTLGGDSYIIQPGDDVHVIRVQYHHKACWLNSLAVATEREFRTIFGQAGFKWFDLWRIENMHGSESYRGPWFEVRTNLGRFTIGWRKRVVNIDWSATGQNFLHLFGDSNNTKWAEGIHAYGYGQGADYLTRIRKELEKGRVASVPA